MSKVERWRENLNENVRLARHYHRTGNGWLGLALHLCEEAVENVGKAALAEAVAKAKKEEA